jgi:hypothetical protein
VFSMSTLTPVSELEGQIAERVVWDLELDTYAHPENIAVNVPLLNRLVRFAGYESVQVTSFAGGTDRVNPHVSGRNPDGTAILSGSATKTRAPRQRTETSDPIRNGEFWASAPESQQPLVEIISPSYRTGQLKVNRNKMSAHVEARGNVRDSAAWADALNLALTSSLRESARKNLVSKPGLAVLGATALFAESQSMDFVHVQPIYFTSLVANVLMAAGVMYGVGTSATKRMRRSESRLSFVPGVQVDRLSFVYGTTALTRLVRPL